MTNDTVAFNSGGVGSSQAAISSGGQGGNPGQNAGGRTTFIASGSPGLAGTLSNVVPVAAGAGLWSIGTADAPNNGILVTNSIVSRNSASGTASDVFGILNLSATYNVIGTGGSGGLVNGVGGNKVGISDPGLMTLADNGGPTRTIAISPTSPAFNAGRNDYAIDSTLKPLTTDQRGSGYPRITGGTVDIGAFEISLQESLVVTTLVDEADVSSDPRLGTGTSLREALAWANQNPGSATITFAADLTGTISLSRGTLTITDSTVIAGPGASVLTIDGNRNSLIFLVTDSRTAIQNVTISGLTLTRGKWVTGGAILNGENLTLSQVVITDNQATSSGGAIYSDNASLTIVESTISANVSSSGGGIYAFGGSVQIAGSTISGNRSESGLGQTPDGGGATFIISTVRIQNSTFSGNSATTGGALSSNLSAITIVNSTFTRNTTAGGSAIQSGGTTNLTVANSIIAGNTGDDLGSNGFTTTLQGQNILTGDPKLGSLADNGGPTKTHMPLPGSPAIDAGSDNVAVDSDGNALLKDQRGRSRRSGTVDIGAVEVASFLVVSTLNDEDDGDSDPLLGTGTSLREAIAWANANPGLDTITFAPGLKGSIVLTRGQLRLSGSNNIQGPGADLITIDGNQTGRIFFVTDGADAIWSEVTISGLTLTHGNAQDGGYYAVRFKSGGAILNREKLTLSRVVVTDNLALANGGGIFSELGDLTIIDSTISDNSASSGAGILVQNGEARIVGSTIAANVGITFVGISSTSAPFGGGVSIVRSNVWFENSTISGNSADFSGAVSIAESTVKFTNVTITRNLTVLSYSAAVDASSFGNNPVTFTNSIVADNAGRNFVGSPAPILLGQNFLSGDPKLGPLADNGGPTKTHRPQPGSPAIGAGINSASLDTTGNPIQTDQRGRQRSPYGSTLGAVEGMSITVVSNPLDLGTFTYGQTSAIVPVEIAGYEVDLNMLAYSDNPARTVEFSHDLQNWSSWGFYVLPKSLFDNSPNVTIWARIAPAANAGSISGNFGFTSSFSTTPVPYSGTVKPAQLTYVADPKARTYGDANPAFTGSVAGLVLNDSMASVVSGTPQFTSAATAATSRGQFPIVGSGLTLINPNYVLAQAPANATALTISPRSLTVKATDASKIQGEANPGFTVSYEGFVLNDGPGSLGGTLAFSTPATSASLPGLYSVIPAGLISDNYDIQYSSGTLSVQSYATATGNVLAEVNAATLSATTKQALINDLYSAILSFDAAQTDSGMDQLRQFIDRINRRDRSFPTTLALRWIAAATRIRRAWNPNL
ncbi:hypothetical protein GC170_21875 [bacterium]|nr:hypothetical protein [bacterium]